MSKRDYYEILGVSKTATNDQIKSAFRTLAKKYHPDVSKEKDAAEKFKEAQEAYAVLSDDAKRRQYDQYGHSAFNQNGGSAGGFDFSGFDFSDIFGDMFDFGFGRNNRTSNRPRKGQDTLVRMNLTFEEAVHGTKKTINIEVTDNCSDCHGAGGHGEKVCHRCHGSGYVNAEQRTMFGTFMTKAPCSVCNGQGKTYDEVCKTCRGSGKVKTKREIEVTIPAGVNTGNQLRVAGKGEAGSNGGPNGDIYIEFLVKPHPLFRREGNDIFITLPITITEAVSGAKKDIPTLDGTVSLTIPTGSSTGDKHRIKGKGVADVQGGRKGDLYVILDIIIPTKLSKQQKKLFDELAKTNLEDSEEFKTFKKYL